MKRGLFEALFVSALAYTVVASAGMPARAHETVVYPVKPLEQRELDSLVDKARITILDALRAAGEKNGRTDNDAVNDNNAVANADSGFSGEDSDFTDAGFADANNGFTDANPGGGTDSADTVLIGTFTCTAYCGCPECCGDYSSGYTASGTLATEGRTVACNVLPMGTHIMVDGCEYVVEDTGWTPYGDAWLDIYFDSHEAALAFGVQQKEVYFVGV